MSNTNLIVKEPLLEDQEFLIGDQVALFRWTRKEKRIDNIWWNISAIILFLFTTFAAFHLTVIGQFLDDVFFSFVFGGIFKYLIYLFCYAYVVFLALGIKIKIKKRAFVLSFAFIFILCLILSDIFLIIDYKTNWNRDNIPIISGNIFVLVMKHFTDAWLRSSVFKVANINFFYFNTPWYNYHIAGGIFGELFTSLFSYLTIFSPLVIGVFLLLSWGGVVFKGNAFWYIGIKKSQTKKLTIAFNKDEKQQRRPLYRNANLSSKKYLSRHVMFFDASVDIKINRQLDSVKQQTEQDIIEDLDLLNDNFLEDEGQGGDLSGSNIKKMSLRFSQFNKSHHSAKDYHSGSLLDNFADFSDDKSQYIMPSRMKKSHDDLASWEDDNDNQKRKQTAILLENIKLEHDIRHRDQNTQKTSELSSSKTKEKPLFNKSTLILGKRVQPVEVLKSVLKNDHEVQETLAQEETVQEINAKTLPEIITSPQTANNDGHDNEKETMSARILRNKIKLQTAESIDENKFKHFKDAVYKTFPTSLLKKNDLTKFQVFFEKNKTIAAQNEAQIKTMLESFKIKGQILRWYVLPLTTIFKIQLEDLRYNHSNLDGIKGDLENVLRQKIVLYFDNDNQSIFIIEKKNEFLSFPRLGDYLNNKNNYTSRYLIKIWLGQDLDANYVTCLFGDLLKSMLILATDVKTTLNTLHVFILQLLVKHKPHQLKLILVDLTKQAFMYYQGLPHLLTPIISDLQNLRKVILLIEEEVHRRKNILSKENLDNVRTFNDKNVSSSRLPLWFIIINYTQIDGDLSQHFRISQMLKSLLQLTKGTGIYLVLNTSFLHPDFISLDLYQSFDYLLQFTILEKDFPSWLGYEKPLPLLPFSYFYFQTIEKKNSNDLVAINGVIVDQIEIETIVDHARRQQKVVYDTIFATITNDILEKTEETPVNYFSQQDENLYQEIILYLKKNHNISTFILQSTFSIGYKKAQMIIKRLQKDGYVSDYQQDQSLIVLI